MNQDSEDSPQYPASTSGQYQDPSAAERIEDGISRLREFLSDYLNTRLLDATDPEADEPLLPGMRILGPDEEVAWSTRGYPWRGDRYDYSAEGIDLPAGWLDRWAWRLHVNDVIDVGDEGAQ